jgi:hypothetical protein
MQQPATSPWTTLVSEDVKKFLTEDRIFHAYGSVREDFFEAPPTLNWSEQGRDQFGQNIPQVFGHHQACLADQTEFRRT